MKLSLVLRQTIFGLGRLAANITVPYEMSREVNGLQVVLHVPLPPVLEATTDTLVTLLRANHVLKQVLIACHGRGIEACGWKIL